MTRSAPSPPTPRIDSPERRPPVVFRSWGATDVGRQRARNEDALFHDAADGVFLVVDGMGGAASGDVAADMARQIVAARVARPEGDPEERVREAVALANNAILDRSHTDPACAGMGCVLTLALADGPSLVVGHVGDTRLYRVADGRLDKLTPDHSPVGALEDLGALSEAEAMDHPRRSVVDRALGIAWVHPADDSLVQLLRVPVEPGDRFLLCSDGLTDQVEATAIAATLDTYPPADALRRLVEEANRRGGIDNVTVLMIHAAAAGPGA